MYVDSAAGCVGAGFDGAGADGVAAVACDCAGAAGVAAVACDCAGAAGDAGFCRAGAAFALSGSMALLQDRCFQYRN